MSQKTISEIDAATTPLAGTEVAEIETAGGDSKKVAVSDLRDPGVAANTSHRTGDGSDHADVAANTSHAGATNNPHSVDRGDLNLDTDDTPAFAGLTVTADHDADTTGADENYVRGIVFLEDGDPDPTWANFPRGTLFIWHEA